MAKPRRRAYTLVELLVVLGIIAILAAILFPVFSRAQSTARQAMCISNCRSIALGVMMYIQDYDDRTPRAVNNAAPGPKLEVHLAPTVPGDTAFLPSNMDIGRPDGFLEPYIHDLGVWRCPSDATQFDPQVRSTNDSLSIANASSYHLNLYLTGTAIGAKEQWTSGDGVSDAAVPRIAQTILARDGYANDGTNIGNATAIGGAQLFEQLYTRHSDHSASARHNGRGNYVMLDGHVKTLLPEDVSPTEADDRPGSPCPGCPDVVNLNAEAFWTIQP